VFRLLIKLFVEISFFKIHFAKSLAIREKTNVICCAVTDFNSILAVTTAYLIIIEFAIREAKYPAIKPTHKLRNEISHAR